MIIYKLTSPSGKCYVGQTKFHIDFRWSQHIKSWERWKQDRSRKKNSSKLYYGFDKYKPDFWQKEIVFKCSSKEELDFMEMYYIELYDSINEGYNITKGGSGVKLDFLTEEHKKNLSIARKIYYESEKGLEWKDYLSEKYSGENNPMYGKNFNHTEETKNDISKKMKGKNSGKNPWNKNKKGVYTEETLEKMSANRKGKGLGKDNSKNMFGKSQTEYQKQIVSSIKSKYWIITDPEGNEFEVFGLSKFCNENNLSQSNITTKSGSRKYRARKK
jgi:hypothetical protein